MERLDILGILTPEEYQELRDEIIERFQEGRINDQEKQELMVKIDELLNNYQDFEQVRQQHQPNPNLVINLEEAEEVGAGAGAGQGQDGGKRRRKLGRGTRARTGINTRRSHHRRQQRLRRKTNKNRGLRKF